MPAMIIPIIIVVIVLVAIIIEIILVLVILFLVISNLTEAKHQDQESRTDLRGASCRRWEARGDSSKQRSGRSSSQVRAASDI